MSILNLNENNLTYKIEMIYNNYDDEILWSMEFQFKLGEFKIFNFHIYEPFLTSSKQNWENLFIPNVNTCIGFYQGNGQGDILVKNEIISFIAHPSGGGGDVISTTNFPLNIILPSLRKMLDEADEKGYFNNEEIKK